MKKLIPVLTALLFSAAVYGQDFPEAKFTVAEMQMTKYDKDTSAHALVLQEFGKTWISSADDMPLIHEYHVRIKLLDNKGFGEGDVVIPLRNSGGSFETIRNIKGFTIYTDDNGGIKTGELDQKKIYREKVSKSTDLVKFALPNLRKGCIIEYSYLIESPFRYNFRTWRFQSDIPKIYSEYEAHIPAIYSYNVALRGYLKLAKNTAVLEKDCFSYYGTKADCSKITYYMSDIPAFVEESHMTASSNYLSAMYFEMETYMTQTGYKQKLTKEWGDVDKEMKDNEDFGSQMKRKDLFKDRLPAPIFAITDTMERAQAVYSYLQKSYKWNNYYGIYSPYGIKKAFDEHTGSVADINISLVAALTAAGINADAVILSTRDNGFVSKLFPQTSDFDYLVARVTIANKVYMLDATDPLLAFGMLPLRCINDQGRVMSLKKPSFWIDMVETQRSTITSALDLTLQNDGKIKGTITNYYLGYAAYEKRKQIKKFNTPDEYVENVDEKLSKIKIIKSDIVDLDSLNKALVEKFDVVIDGYSKLDNERIVFTPSFWDRLTENPFKLTERNYPIDMGSTTDRRLMLTLHYTDNFIPGKMPESVAIGLPNQGGRFLTVYQNENNMLTYSQIQQLNKAIYWPEEYPYLKELFNKIIQNQQSTIVFNKKP